MEGRRLVIFRYREEERPSFLKKRSKKPLIAVADLWPTPVKRHKSFLLLFFKKEDLSFFFKGLPYHRYVTLWLGVH
jgi:hypothetical protein